MREFTSSTNESVWTIFPLTQKFMCGGFWEHGTMLDIETVYSQVRILFGFSIRDIFVHYQDICE